MGISKEFEKWLKNNFNEEWQEVKTDIDFNVLEPSRIRTSLHVYEERYEIDGEIYRLLYSVSSEDTTPLIEKLKK
jgi:hypothetical protein